MGYRDLLRRIAFVIAAILVTVPVSNGTAQAQQGLPARPASGSGGQMPAAAPPGQAAPPRCDANCVRSNAGRAAEICAPRIEAQAPSDFDWITRPNPSIFQQADPSSPADGVVRYRGDSIRFQSADKAWLRISYECAFDVGTQSVVFVHVHAGRLDQPPSLTAPIAPPASEAPISAGPARPQMVQPTMAQQGPQQAVAPPVRKPPRPHVGEPSPVTIQQESLNPKLD